MSQNIAGTEALYIWHLYNKMYNTKYVKVQNAYSFFEVYYNGDRYERPYFTCSPAP